MGKEQTCFGLQYFSADIEQLTSTPFRLCPRSILAPLFLGADHVLVFGLPLQVAGRLGIGEPHEFTWGTGSVPYSSESGGKRGEAIETSPPYIAGLH